jgi:hypothetical protein
MTTDNHCDHHFSERAARTKPGPSFFCGLMSTVVKPALQRSWPYDRPCFASEPAMPSSVPQSTAIPKNTYRMLWNSVRMMSAISPKADVDRIAAHVRSVPILLQNSQNAVRSISYSSSLLADNRLSPTHWVRGLHTPAQSGCMNGRVPETLHLFVKNRYRRRTTGHIE